MAKKRVYKYTNQPMETEKEKPTKDAKWVSNVSLSPDVMRKEQLAQRKQQGQKKTSGNVWDDLGNTFLKNPLGTLKAAAEVGKEALNKKKESVKAPAKNAVASSVSNGGSVKSSAKDTAYRNMANRKAQATKQNTTQTQPKKTFNANEAMAQRRAAAQAQGKGNWNANEEMARRRAEAQKKKAYQNAFGGKGK